MKIEQIEIGFKPAQIQLYFIIKTKYDQKQITNLLAQINQIIYGSSSKIVMPMNLKQKTHINVEPQKIHNQEDKWVIYSYAARSKNVDVSVETCYVVHGKMEEVKYKTDVQKKTLSICEPNQCLEAYQEAQEFKASNQEELLAFGLKVLVYPTTKHTVRGPSASVVARFIKKMTDVLKNDKKLFSQIISITFGIIN